LIERKLVFDSENKLACRSKKLICNYKCSTSDRRRRWRSYGSHGSEV